MEKIKEEIIKRILSNVGVSTGEMFGKAGISENLLDKKLKVEYDNTIVPHNIYGGQIEIDNKSKIRAILIDLTIDGVPEFILLYKFSSMPINAVKWIYDEDDLVQGFMKIYNSSDKKWVDHSLYLMAQALAGFEKIVSAGFLWEKCEDINDLYEAGSGLI